MVVVYQPCMPSATLMQTQRIHSSLLLIDHAYLFQTSLRHLSESSGQDSLLEPTQLGTGQLTSTYVSASYIALPPL